MQILRWLAAAYLFPTLLFVFTLRAKAAGEIDLRNSVWSATWIAQPKVSGSQYGVYYFRKSIHLPTIPKNFVVHVSGDTRYRLFVNGTSICFGPQRNDRYAWHYDTVDIARWLRVGTNVLAASVWNYGDEKPYAAITHRTGFIMQGDTSAEEVVNTDASWKVLRDEAYTPLPVDNAKFGTFFGVGPGDKVEGTLHPWGWEGLDFEDKKWPNASVIDRGMPAGFGTQVDWLLTPRTIPFMAETLLRLKSVRRTTNTEVSTGFLRGESAVKIPPWTTASILLDQGEETNAFPHILVEEGAKSSITLTYAEALFRANGEKDHRDEIEGKNISGFQDVFFPDGGRGRRFSTLGFRTYRYIQLDISTADEALTISDFFGLQTGYPFKQVGFLQTDSPQVNAIWKAGLRTARLCAFETYMDCPYYEQLQYAGDTRIQALISLYAFADDRLVRNALEQFDASRLPNGLTQSRYPSDPSQIIPPFSLVWVNMVHDYWMHRVDLPLIEGLLPGVHSVLSWFKARIDLHTGMLGALPYWNFVDWAPEWPWINAARPGGEPPSAHKGNSAVLSLQFAYTLRQAAELFRAFNQEMEAARYEELANSLCHATTRHCWDREQQLYGDDPQRSAYSQHTNTMAVLAKAIDGADATQLMRRVLSSSGLIQSTLYYRFYVLEAASQVGLASEYIASLAPWQQMLDRGLTTFAERPDPTRSDCHAWSASPSYALLATSAGIRPEKPGFASIIIQPALGSLQKLDCQVAHPAGTIHVQIKQSHTEMSATIDVPAPGRFVWGGNEVLLHVGTQQIAVTRR